MVSSMGQHMSNEHDMFERITGIFQVHIGSFAGTRSTYIARGAVLNVGFHELLSVSLEFPAMPVIIYTLQTCTSVSLVLN